MPYGMRSTANKNESTRWLDYGFLCYFPNKVELKTFIMSKQLTGNLIYVLVIWVVIFGTIYLYFDARQAPIIAFAREGTAGEVVIPRSPDGHYYVRGSVNGYPVDFMVDTGASIVSVSKEISKAANLPRGQPANFSTAGGVVTGEIVPGLTVEAGGIAVNDLSVSVGMHGRMALLGQNFLRRIDVIQSNDKMILKVRTE